MSKKLTNEIVDQRLIGRNIKRLDQYINIGTAINFQCLEEDCQYIWTATPDSILGALSGCPKCAKSSYLSNDIIDQKLVGRNIKRIDDYINNHTNINFQCLIFECNYIWKTAPSHIISNLSGCPSCSGKAPLNNDIVDKKLIGRNIERLDDYINAKTKIRFKCLIPNCNYIWLATTNHIFSHQSGCPACSIGKNENIVYTTLINNGICVQYHKNIKDIIYSENRHLIIDFYCNNSIIEYNGIQHYTPTQFGGIDVVRAQDNFVKQQERDKYLQRICDENNIKLIWIDGRKYTNSKLEKYVIEKIIPILI